MRLQILVCPNALTWRDDVPIESRFSLIALANTCYKDKGSARSSTTGGLSAPAERPCVCSGVRLLQDPVSRLCLCREASGRQVYCLQARLNESQPDLDAAILIGVEPRVMSSCLVREIRIAPVPDWQAFLSGFAESVVGETEGEGAMLFAFLAGPIGRAAYLRKTHCNYSNSFVQVPTNCPYLVQGRALLRARECTERQEHRDR
jgi:hypothetical protein